MSQQTINVGTAPNDGTGTPLRTAFQYTNSNFSELYTAVGPSGNNIVVPGNATITGDLTVDSGTLRVNSSNDRVGVGTNSPTSKLHVFGAGTNTSLTISDVGANYNIVLGTQSADIAQLAAFNTTIGSGSKEFWLTASAHVFNTWSGSAYSSRFVIASDGVCTWSNVGGVAGTAMTLNATGLGVGASPSTRLHIQNTGDVYARIATTSVSKAGVQFSANGVVRSHLLYDDGAGTTYLTTGTGFGGSGQALAIQSGTSLSIYTNNQLATAQMTLDASGNLLVGTTSAGGSISNASYVIGGIFSTLNGILSSVATATPTTLFAAPAESILMVTASVNGASPSDYKVVAVVKRGGGAVAITTISSATSITITASGTNIQVTQTSGGSQNVYFNVLRLA